MFTISESWLDASVSDLEIEVPGYNICRVDGSNKTGGGICATFWTPIILMGDISISTTGFHQLWLKIQVRNLKSIIICTVYRPPNTLLTCWENDVDLSLDKPVYIMGDLNCNLLSTERREWEPLTSIYESFNLLQLLAAPTTLTELSQSLLDVNVASQTKQVVSLRKPNKLSRLVSWTARLVTMTWSLPSYILKYLDLRPHILQLGVLKSKIQSLFSLICPVHPCLLRKYLTTLMTNYMHLTCLSMEFSIITLWSDQLKSVENQIPAYRRRCMNLWSLGMSGTKQLAELMIHMPGLPIKTWNTKSGSQSEQRRVNSS